MSWTYFASGLSIVVQIGYIGAISRLLPPSAFGTVALAGLSIVTAQYLANLGICRALIQSDVVTASTIRVAFTLSLLVSILVTAAIMVVAAPLAAAVGSPDITSVVRALALGIVIGSAGAPAQALLRRAERYKALAMVTLTSYILGTVAIGLATALAGFGVWSLVAATLGQSILMTTLAYALVRHPIRPTLRAGDRRYLLAFGGGVSATGFMEFLTGNVDTLAVGHVFGPVVLGQYSRASSLVSLPMYQVIDGVNRVMLPTFSRIRQDRELVARAYVGGLALVTAIVVPGAALLAALAQPVVRVLLGDQWGTAAELLPILAVAYAFDFSSTIGAVLLEAEAMLVQKLVILGLHFVALLMAVAISLALGLPVLWFAIAWAGGMGIRHIGYQILLSRRFPASRRTMFKVQAEAVVLAALVGGAGRLATRLPTRMPYLQLALGSLAGGLVWLAFVVGIQGMEARVQLLRFGLGQRIPGVRRLLRWT